MSPTGNTLEKALSGPVVGAVLEERARGIILIVV